MILIAFYIVKRYTSGYPDTPRLYLFHQISDVHRNVRCRWFAKPCCHFAFHGLCVILDAWCKNHETHQTLLFPFGSVAVYSPKHSRAKSDIAKRTYRFTIKRHENQLVTCIWHDFYSLKKMYQLVRPCSMDWMKIMNHESGMMRKEAVVSYFKVSFLCISA
jgi:hypothetical protein